MITFSSFFKIPEVGFLVAPEILDLLLFDLRIKIMFLPSILNLVEIEITG